MKKLLIVEDNKDINALLYHLFSQEGYKVQQCFDGERGMELLKEVAPDVVILDILLPKLDGRELLLFIQSLNPRPQVFVFSSSGWSGIEAKNVHYCPKPTTDLESLCQQVKEVFPQ